MALQHGLSGGPGGDGAAAVGAGTVGRGGRGGRLRAGRRRAAVMRECVEPGQVGLDGLRQDEGVELVPAGLELRHPRAVGLGAGLDALEGRLRPVVHAADPGADSDLADELDGRQEQVLEEASSCA